MTDLFNFGSGATDLDSEDRYGTTGDMKKTQYVMQLLGFPSDADTLKCLLTAAEKGIEMESAVLDITTGQQDSEDYRKISPFGIVPALKEANYMLAGEPGMSVFIEGRGLGNRLAPRNAAVLAEQMYWVDIARSDVAPHIETLMQEQVLGPMSDPAYQANTDAIDEARSALAVLLDAVDAQLSKKEFIVGGFSYADIHWTAYIHLLTLTSEGALMDQRRNLKAWLDRIKTHKSFSGQDVVAYDLMPTLEDIKSKRLKDVVCGEF
jgi:glutathione S-transferase